VSDQAIAYLPSAYAAIEDWNWPPRNVVLTRTSPPILVMPADPPQLDQRCDSAGDPRPEQH
jgi:hypothetical protein